MNSSPFLKETFFIALSTMVVGLVISTLWMRATDGDWPECHIQYSVAASLLLTGASVHILAQYFGINKWYCKNGIACK